MQGSTEKHFVYGYLTLILPSFFFFFVKRFTKEVITTPEPVKMKTDPPYMSNWCHSIVMRLFFPYILNKYKHATYDVTRIS